MIDPQAALQKEAEAIPVYTPEQARDMQVSFINKVYNWLGVGLVSTALSAWAISESPATLELIFGSRFGFIGLLLLQLVLVGWLGARVMTMSTQLATALFLGYTVLTGAMFGAILIVYTGESIALTFGVSAATFITMSILGYTTKRDLTSLRGHLTTLLIGLLIAMVANWFMKSEGLSYLISIVGVFLFTGLIMFDTNKLKNMALQLGDDEQLRGNMAVAGALTLYLDFVNLFLFLLRFLGRRK